MQDTSREIWWRSRRFLWCSIQAWAPFLGLVFFRSVYVLVFLLSFGNAVFYIRAARCISIGFLERKRTAPEVRTFFGKDRVRGMGADGGCGDGAVRTSKSPRFHSKITISIGKHPSADQNHPFPDSKKPCPKEKIRRMLAICPAKQQNYIKECPGAWKKRWPQRNYLPR